MVGKTSLLLYTYIYSYTVYIYNNQWPLLDWDAHPSTCVWQVLSTCFCAYALWDYIGNPLDVTRIFKLWTFTPNQLILSGHEIGFGQPEWSRLNHTIFSDVFWCVVFAARCPRICFLLQVQNRRTAKMACPIFWTLEITLPLEHFRTIGCCTALLHMAQSDSTHWRSPRICLGSPIDKYNYVYILCMYKHVYIYIYTLINISTHMYIEPKCPLVSDG